MSKYSQLAIDLAQSEPDIERLQDSYSICVQIHDAGDPDARSASAVLRDGCLRAVGAFSDPQDELSIIEIYRDALLLDAKDDFDCYMLYMELDRPAGARFYAPRRSKLKPIVDALQRLADDELDELFLSQPPRTGKTALMQFYMSWLMGRDSESSNLYCSFSDTITNAFYNGMLELLGDVDTYRWNRVFAGQKVVQTNSRDETINVDRKRKYPSITCRSIFGTLNGACDVRGLLVADDLVEGIETALNPDRLRKLWDTVCNNMITRAVGEKKKFLWMGTRWSVADPIGRRLDLLTNDASWASQRFEVVSVPALDENGESNFDYEFGLGMTTQDYVRLRSGFERNDDMASWLAQYQNEPIEREGTLFSPGSMRYFTGVLPDGSPDRMFMAVDPAFGGGDYTAAPVCAQYGDDVYVVDVVYTDGEKGESQGDIIVAIERNNVAAVQFEDTRATRGYREDVERKLRERGIRINLTGKPAPTNKAKESRIFDMAPNIREQFVFLDDGKRSKRYQAFMQSVYAFKVMGKNKHDDAPDSLAMAANMAYPRQTRAAKAVPRLF